MEETPLVVAALDAMRAERDTAVLMRDAYEAQATSAKLRAGDEQTKTIDAMFNLDRMRDRIDVMESDILILIGEIESAQTTTPEEADLAGWIVTKLKRMLAHMSTDRATHATGCTTSEGETPA
jgi:phage shock protein A